MNKTHHIVLILAILILLVVYVTIPKPQPVSTIEISNLEILNITGDAAVAKADIKWESDIQPTYITFDIQPQNAPSEISPEDRDEYHLLFLPYKWVNTHTIVQKKGELQQVYVFYLKGHTDFTAIARLKNDDIPDTEFLAEDAKQFSVSGPELI